MAFTRVEQGDFAQLPVTRHAPIPSGGQTIWISLGDGCIRRCAGLVGTTGVHAGLIFLLLSRLLGPVPLKLPVSLPNLTLIDLGRAPEDSSASDDAAASPAEVKPAPSESPAASPAEWSMQRILVPRTAPSPPAPAKANAIPASGVAAGGRAGGGYDPYAGAAPENMDRLPGGAAADAPAYPDHDRSEALIAEKLRNRLREIDPAIRFPLTARLTIGGNGRIVEAVLTGRAVPSPRLAAIAFQLRGSLLLPAAEAKDARVRQMSVSL